MIAFSPRRTSEPVRPGTSGAPLIVLSIATDGFKPGRLLEVSARALDRNNLSLAAGEFYGRLAWPEAAICEILERGDTATAMHAENGLLEEILAEPELHDATYVDVCLAGWLDGIGASGEERSPLICFSPDFVRPWLKEFLPRSLGRLSQHDQIDIGTLCRALRVPVPKRKGRSEEAADMAVRYLQALLPGRAALEELRAAS